MILLFIILVENFTPFCAFAMSIIISPCQACFGIIISHVLQIFRTIHETAVGKMTVLIPILLMKYVCTDWIHNNLSF